MEEFRKEVKEKVSVGMTSNCLKSTVFDSLSKAVTDVYFDLYVGY